ncbi:MAG: lipopolysaccharide biosynthesis protein [Phycisphaerae bacterium]|nr:lipopolysaccharide biosynthesis protein [Phycisphaerae bacterium]
MNDDNAQVEPFGIEHTPGVLFARTVKSGCWIVAGKVLTQALFTIKFIIVLRMLAVDDIGLIGVAALMMATLTNFSETGFRAAMVQKRGEIETYLNTAWSLEVIRGAALFTLLFLAAPLAAQMKVPPEKVGLTIAVIRILGVSLLLGPLGSMATIYFTKELQFRKSFWLQSTAEIVDFIVTVTVALLYRSIWAVVAGKLAAGIVSVIVSYRMHPYRPRFAIDRQKAKEMWRFGRWIFSINVIGFLMTQGDDYFVWGTLGVMALAYYQTAYKFANIPATQITTVISQVAFPAYAKLQHDIPRLRNAYLKVFELTAFLAFPCTGLIFILARDFVILFPGEQWLPIVPAMQILALKGLERSLGASRGPLFSAVGKPGTSTGLQIVKLVALIAFIYPFTHRWGFVGTSALIVIIGMAAQPFGLYLAKRILQCRMSDLIRPAILPLAATLIMVATVMLIRTVALQKTNVTSFLLLGLLASAAYLVVVYVGDRLVRGRIREIIAEQVTFLLKQR